MENESEISKTGKRGGHRAGAGRKKGSKDQVTIKSLLEGLYNKTNGQHYEEILINDFLEARQADDKQLVIKYHQLILQKVMSSLAKIEVTDTADAVAAKKAAFEDALNRLTTAIKS